MGISICEARRDHWGVITVSGPHKYGCEQDWIDYWVGCRGQVPETQQYKGMSIIWYGNTGYVVQATNV